MKSTGLRKLYNLTSSINGTKYSGMDEVKFVEYSLQIISRDMVCLRQIIPNDTSRGKGFRHF